MHSNFSPEDADKVRQLAETRQRNNEVSWMLCDYLNDRPCAITKALMEGVNPDGSLSQEAAFSTLLAALCGLDTEQRERDKQLADDYFRPAIKRLDTESYARNPYYRNIQIPELTFGNWELRYEEYQPFEAFICNELQVEPDFKEIPRVGFFDETFRFPAVLEKGREWMSIKPNEIETMQPALDALEGRVLTFGLGLGYFAYMASLDEGVQGITVVEHDREAIGIFEDFILPKFSQASKVEIVWGDAFEYAEKKMPGEAFDYAFVDLWHDASDGLDPYLKMKKLERFSDRTAFLYWIEDSLLSRLRWQVFDWAAQNARSHGEMTRCLSKPFLQELASSRMRVDRLGE